MTKAGSAISAHLGRRIAIRIAGVAIATSGLALLGVGTLGSPLSTGHDKLVAVTQNDNCQGNEDAPAANTGDNEGDGSCCTTKSGTDEAPIAATGDDSEGDNSSCSTGGGSSSGGSSSAGSSSAGTSAASNPTSTATAGVQAATTPVVPKTGADIEIGLGLGLVVTGGGLALAATRRGRKS